jgi:ribosomal protein L37AE/L43A
MDFLSKLFGKKQPASSQKKDLPVSSGHVDKDKPLHCPKCGDKKRDTTPRFAVFVCNKCRATVSIDDYNVHL